mmetsp:Transcript_23596/g.33810  ORF Transcript_23596/g.33810 Transcript_23596/m.33810 type:complete len:85 (+) Transcript_23596:489-743(+)
MTKADESNKNNKEEQESSTTVDKEEPPFSLVGKSTAVTTTTNGNGVSGAHRTTKSRFNRLDQCVQCCSKSLLRCCLECLLFPFK